ncbi:MAG: DUF2815 family protein [Clostridiales bacterium]|nr:DUF2815 family protein [Clostridiales bacterium]
MKAKSETKVIVGMVRLSYAHIFEPSAREGQEPKYSVSLLIPKDDKKTIGTIKKAIEAATQAGVTKFGGKIPSNLRSPLRDGDEERDEYPEYHGQYFVNASAKTPPGIVDKKRQTITDSREVHSGDYALVSVNFYAYSTAGNKGIACGLNNIMKIKDGEWLGGRSKAEDDFADVDLAEFEDDDDDMSFLA